MPCSPRVIALSSILLPLLCNPARAADTDASQGARALYQQERARCAAQATEDRAACIREAGAALQASKRGQLDDSPASYEQNRLARCSYLRGDDRQDCERRMRGEGTVRGSVEGGGIYRELVTRVPAGE